MTTLRDQLVEVLTEQTPTAVFGDGTIKIVAEPVADALLPLIRDHVAAAVQAERERALHHAADWCAECLTCGDKHQPQPDPRGDRYADSFAHPSDGHIYRPRQIAVANWLRAALDGSDTP